MLYGVQVKTFFIALETCMEFFASATRLPFPYKFCLKFWLLGRYPKGFGCLKHLSGGCCWMQHVMAVLLTFIAALWRPPMQALFMHTLTRSDVSVIHLLRFTSKALIKAWLQQCKQYRGNKNTTWLIHLWLSVSEICRVTRLRYLPHTNLGRIGLINDCRGP